MKIPKRKEWQLNLEFHGGNEAQLTKTSFYHTLGGAIQIQAVRGNIAPLVNESFGTFRWSVAVRALSYFLVYSKLEAAHGVRTPVLTGGIGSPAASLDYALARNSNWLSEIFGHDKDGIPIAKRLFYRENPERKRPGPVSIVVQQRVMSLKHVTIILDGCRVDNSTVLNSLVSHLAEHWSSPSLNQKLHKNEYNRLPSSDGMKDLEACALL